MLYQDGRSGGGGGGGGSSDPPPPGWLVTLHHYDLDKHQYQFLVVFSIVIIMTMMSIFSVASKSNVLIRYPAAWTQVFKSLR